MYSESPRSILSPLRRDKKRDFANGSGAELIKSKIIQVLATEGQTPNSSGELPWTDFGSTVHALRHQRNDDILSEMARVYVRDALKKWVPEVEVVEVDVKREDGVFAVTIRFQYAQRPSSATHGSEFHSVRFLEALND